MKSLSFRLKIEADNACQNNGHTMIWQSWDYNSKVIAGECIYCLMTAIVNLNPSDISGSAITLNCPES